ncbi:hypothetical protein M1L60_08300 [Actinoplanes sp. TRM 88003]|uniref:Uncharacterized protein n=1 Tax=Paractinoplanes aksuensis TaxID=2939490 RepID=A0ABT1DJE1_9ACTN|nr:hypothetical protein [Actinoplanes aksuensis]MCO8270598.1 hypothetical protein [Actinoplanes aksuensis]
MSIDAPPSPATGRTETRDGILVGIHRDGKAETGFTATWTTTVDMPSACEVLAAWAVRTVAHPDPAEVGEALSPATATRTGCSSPPPPTAPSPPP